METPTAPATPSEVWIAACAHELQRRWRSIDPEELETVATQLYLDDHFSALPPASAARLWLSPVCKQMH